MTQSRYSICITELATEMPRCFSISIQSDVACREALRAFTLPAIWMAPENSSSFSVSVVLPASGCEMMANVRRRRTCEARSADMGQQRGPGPARGEAAIIAGGQATRAMWFCRRKTLAVGCGLSLRREKSWPPRASRRKVCLLYTSRCV